MPTKQRPRSGSQDTSTRRTYIQTDDDGATYVETRAPRRKKLPITGYYSLHPQAMQRLELSPKDMRIVHMILAAQDSRRGGIAYIRQQDIAEGISSSEAYVQRRISILRQRDIVIAEGQAQWRVNAHIGYQGRADAWASLLSFEVEPDWTGRRTEARARLALVEETP